jgi:SMC interacting uncharacterized protein involved in chromosome segregation
VQKNFVNVWKKVQKEVSELKAQLNKHVADEVFVGLLKEEQEKKTRKCDKLESENESLERSLKIKEIEQTRLIENRDQLLRNYETMLKKEKEKKERLKHDMESYQQKFLKITSSPHKSQRKEH